MWNHPCERLLRARLTPDRADADTQVVAHIPCRSCGTCLVRRMRPSRRLRRSGFFGQAQDFLECLYVSHRVVDGIVVVGCPSQALPALGVAPVPVVADAAGRVPERVRVRGGRGDSESL